MAMPMAAVAAAMPSCCVKSAVAGAAAGQWVERGGGRVARSGLRSGMWQMGGCYWPSEQLRCAWRAPPGRLAVVSCTTSSTTTSTTTTDVNVPTVAATKEAFLKALLKPIPSSYETAIQELLVQQHSVRYNATYTYDPIFALGVVTVFNRLIEGYPSNMESQSIFEAYISALNEDPDLYRMDAERLEEWAASVSGSEIAEFTRREAGVEGILKIIGTRAAGIGKINYNRFFAIGLFRLLERANANDSAVLEQVKGYQENSSWSPLQQEQESLMESRMEDRTLQSPKSDPECGSVSTTGRNEENLVEVSDALETVAKALRDVARKKALAEEAAAVWKRKYEMERGRNDRLERLTAGHAALDSMRPEEPSPSHNPETDADELRASGVLTGKLPIPRNSPWPKVEGMINQQMPPHSAVSFSELDLDTVESVFPADKASFNLTWGTTSKKSKTDVVSFKSGDITMAIGTNKQITLVWNSPPRSMLILKKPNSSTVHELSKRMIRWLNEETDSVVYVEPRVKGELVQEDPYFEFLQKCETEEEVMNLHKKVDLVITLGGDGTVLWAASMFKGPMPPLVPFSMGSLGFMTQFESDLYKESLMKVIRGPVYITLRHRLHCQIVRNVENLKDGNYSSEPEEHLVLNEVSVDRGMASALSNLQCYCDGHFVTTVQGDGLILSTPSGSTAYSLAAGGSMLHPQVPGILFTPICPHSLSFRPVILPEYVTLRIQLPLKSRGQAWASFDGKARQRLNGGDALIVRMSAWPVPTACDEESSGDFLRSVREGLHWNLRVCQLSDGPQIS